MTLKIATPTFNQIQNLFLSGATLIEVVDALSLEKLDTPIPPLLLSRMQIMFRSGATMDDVATSMKLALHDPVSPKQELSVPIKSATQLVPLAAETETLRLQVDALMELESIRKFPDIAGALDLIVHQTRAILQEVSNVANGVEPDPAVLETLLPAPKVPKNLIKPAPTKHPSSADMPSPEVRAELLEPTPQDAGASEITTRKTTPNPATNGKTSPLEPPGSVLPEKPQKIVKTMLPPPKPESSPQPSSANTGSKLHQKISTAVNQINSIVSKQGQNEDSVSSDR